MALTSFLLESYLCATEIAPVGGTNQSLVPAMGPGSDPTSTATVASKHCDDGSDDHQDAQDGAHGSQRRILATPVVPVYVHHRLVRLPLPGLPHQSSQSSSGDLPVAGSMPPGGSLNSESMVTLNSPCGVVIRSTTYPPPSSSCSTSTDTPSFRGCPAVAHFVTSSRGVVMLPYAPSVPRSPWAWLPSADGAAPRPFRQCLPQSYLRTAAGKPSAGSAWQG